MKSFAGWITACVPYFRCQRYIRRAVESLLSQSYPWIRVIVINDGDSQPPWRELASIKDPRLLRFSLPVNVGSYYCLEVARRATPDPYFMMQDADDWAAPQRAATLLKCLLIDGSDLAVSAQPQFIETGNGSPCPIAIRWNRVTQEQTQERFVVQKLVTGEFRYRVPHAGLIRTAKLRELGGYYGGFRVGWDTLLTNLVLMTGSVSWTPQPLYHRLVRAESLTHSSRTGAQSPYASAVHDCLGRLYKECYALYEFFCRAEISQADFLNSVRVVCGKYVNADDQTSLDRHARALRRKMA